MTTMGIDAAQLSDDDLVRELRQLHLTRSDTFFHGSDDALSMHTARTSELEAEYLRRNPDREVDPLRLRQRS
jgi:hypothetical protein